MANDDRSTVSLAVWDMPLPVIAGERFTIKAAAKAGDGATLTGRGIEVCDAAGAVVARGELGPSPWPDTDALYWAAVEVPAPAQPGFADFSVRLAADGAAPAPNAPPWHFSVAVTARPEHRLTVRVVDKDSAAALADVEIRIGTFRARTDASGRAELRVTAGSHDVVLWKAAYDAPPTPVAVNGDAAIEIAMTHIPEEHPDARWVM